jgi:Ca-activated chloride channel family protein
MTAAWSRRPRHAAVAAAFVALLAAQPGRVSTMPQTFTFRTDVDLINVTATVTDRQGRFVPGLRASDFQLFEDGKPQTIQQFDTERVPVSLGLALDTSGSMAGERIAAAQAALNRFLFDLLGDQDEVFLYRFDSRPVLVQGWTTNRFAVATALGAVRPVGGTAIYDTVAEAIPLTQSGSRRKKALVVISDGNDTSSRLQLGDLAPLLRQTEVLVYAIGIDSGGTPAPRNPAPQTIPVPSPFPGKAPPPAAAPPRPSGPGRVESGTGVLQSITDQSGGRTEIIRSPGDLASATAGIADELSRQYFLGYSSQAPKDGRWHSIELRLTRGNGYTVRARRGFTSN